MSQNVLLSGGSGFLGAFIIEQLLERNYDRIAVLTRGENRILDEQASYVFGMLPKAAILRQLQTA